jgi:hypothetical protein
MQYVNQYDSGANCSSVGFNAERLFVNLANSKGYTVKNASKEHNMFKHIDLYLSKLKGGEGIKTAAIDVKARKKSSRNSSCFNDNWIWLEFVNVNGDDGWLKGCADYIAFERKKDFVIVPRPALLFWSKDQIKIKNKGFSIKAMARNSADAKYKYYTRSGRQDLLTQVHINDVLSGVKGIKIWKKSD